MNQTDREDEEAIADRYSSVGPHDERCHGAELCREHFLEKLRAAKEAAAAAKRPLMIVGFPPASLAVHMTNENNQEVEFFRWQRPGTEKLIASACAQRQRESRKATE